MTTNSKVFTVAYSLPGSNQILKENIIAKSGASAWASFLSRRTNCFVHYVFDNLIKSKVHYRPEKAI